jgi:hypothetical protein
MTNQNHRERALEFALKVPGPTSDEDIIKRARLFAEFIGDEEGAAEKIKSAAAA